MIEKHFADGRTAVVMPLLEGRGRIGIGLTGDDWFDDTW